MHVVVIGGGVNGLAAAWHAARREARVTLFEQFALFHDRGSSHGTSRITRSTYPAETYVRFATRAHTEEWPRLERDSGRRLLHPTPGCFFGPAGRGLDAYVAAIAAAGDAVEVLDVDEGRRRFPSFRFPDAAKVIDDGTAALVAAADTLRALAERAAAEGATLREDVPVLRITPEDAGVRVDTARGETYADRVIVAAGPWSARLLPAVAPRLTVVRQNIGYFRLDAPAAAQRSPAFPVWAYLAEDSLHYYGLPEFGRDGVKAARHWIADDADDADQLPPPDDAALIELRAWLSDQLAVPIVERVDAETCLYTNTPNEDFVIDLHPADPRIVIAAGFSGHGFKFGPLTGRLLAELALDGRSSVPEFEADRPRFACPPI